MPLSKIEKLAQLLGGEDKLPPKIERTPPVTVQDETNGLSHPASESRQPARSASSGPGQVDSLPSVGHYFTGLAPTSSMWQPDTTCEREAKKREAQMAAPTTASISTPLLSRSATIKPDPNQGVVAPLGLSFVPILAAAKFPYKFIASTLLQPVATAIFDGGKFWKRDWDLYYVYSHYLDHDKPVIFVPEHQFQTLLDEVNCAFPKAKATITDDLLCTFDFTNPNIRPRWLGHCNEKDEHDHRFYFLWQHKSHTMLGTPEPDDRSVAAFKAMMDAAVEVAKNKTKAGKARKKEDVFVQRQDMSKMMKRAQRYLGLLAKSEDSLIAEMFDMSISPIDTSRPPPHVLDHEVVIISMDVETYERNHHCVTEVGVATLDTCDVAQQAPGRVGKDWHKHIRARHFRVIEHKHLNNTEFVHGCADRFEFGESELVSLKSLPQKLSACFNEPFNKPDEPNVSQPSIDPSSVNAADWKLPPKRNIILLGHDVNGDISMLHSIGFDPLHRSNLLEVLDTARMGRSYFREANAKSLGGILCEFDLAGWHLHNAGNDAVYTIQAMLAICVKDASERGSEEAERRREEAQKAKMEKAAQVACERVLEENEGWGGERGEDGGVAVKPSEQAWAMAKVKDCAGKNYDGLNRGPPVFYTSGGNVLDV